MADQKPLRDWKRFSIRTLLVATTFVCLYLACWGPTKTQGVADVEGDIECEERYWTGPVPPFLPFDYRAEAIAPLIVRGWQRGNRNIPSVESIFGTTSLVDRASYHIWLFGLTIRLPFTSHEHQVPMSNKPPIGKRTSR